MAQNKSKFNGRIRLLVIIGCSLLVLLVCAIASLFILEIEDVIYADGQVTSEFTIDMVSHLDGRITKLYVNAGQDVKKGDIFGLIRFGSRCDVWLPVGSVPQVCLGQTMIAGESVLSDLNSSEKDLRECSVK